MEIKNSYDTRIRKEEFYTKPNNEEDLCDQSQLANASIKEMAKKFGIEALESKARKMYIENQSLLDTLYGNDFTKMHTSKEELLNTKKKINKLFEKIPALIRKQEFNDNPLELINAYTSLDENKLNKLRGFGIISDTQFNYVQKYNENSRKEKLENETKARFIKALEQSQGALYEKYKETGTINISNNQNNTGNMENIHPSV